jgi:hypothetical protein
MPWAPEEISAWSIEELEAEIQKGLPEGWSFHSHPAPDGYWEYKIQSLGDLGPVIHMEKENADRRLGLLDVYGWLWLETLPKPPEGSPWALRRDVTIGVVTGHANIRGSEIPDPEDLDPAEVALVHKTRK